MSFGRHRQGDCEELDFRFQFVVHEDFMADRLSRKPFLDPERACHSTSLIKAILLLFGDPIDLIFRGMQPNVRNFLPSTNTSAVANPHLQLCFFFPARGDLSHLIPETFPRLV